jgi:hypothetical protein
MPYKDKEVYLRKARERTKRKRAENRKIIWKWKEVRGCAICGEKDPRCLDAHHVIAAQKKKDVCDLCHYAEKTVREELDKCMCICANCHRKLTYRITKHGTCI